MCVLMVYALTLAVMYNGSFHPFLLLGGQSNTFYLWVFTLNDSLESTLDG